MSDRHTFALEVRNCDIPQTERKAVEMALISLILEGRLLFPIKKPSLSDTASAFQKLVDLDTSTIISAGRKMPGYEWARTAAHTMLYGRSYYSFNKASSRFQFDDRMRSSRSSHQSVKQSWSSPESWITDIWRIKCTRLTSSLLRCCIRIHSLPPSQFSTTTAKAVYDMFNATIILDPCFGWGDRFAAAMSRPGTISFTGIDPRKGAEKGYISQVKMYSRLRTDMNMAAVKSSFIVGCAELVKLKGFDMVFTSPPFFKLEKYHSGTGSRNQSVHGKADVLDWLEKFMNPMLRNSWDSLKVNGIFALHMKDMKTEKYCQHIHDVVSAFRGSMPLNPLCILADGMPAYGRPQVSCEPIWCWKKLF